MMRIVGLVGVLLLASGCATSAKGLGESAIDAEYTSTKAPGEVALCISTTYNGSNPLLQVSPTHYVVMRNNGYGVPMVRWDIHGTPTGSRVEYRVTIALGSGQDKAQACL